MEQVIKMLANIELCMRWIATCVLLTEIATIIMAVNSFFDKR